jgi:hypothetical protein
MIAEALSVYMLMCAKVPFEALQTTTAELPVTLGVSTYALPTNLSGIVSIRITYGTNQYRRLKRSHVRKFDSFSSVANNRPVSYARWGNSIELFPPPNSGSYTYRIRHWMKPTIATDVEDTVLCYPDEWFELHKFETLFRGYIHIEEPEKAMMLVQPAMLPRQPSPKRVVTTEIGIIPKLWNDLLMTMNQREAPDDDFSINPLVRSYTWR